MLASRDLEFLESPANERYVGIRASEHEREIAEDNRAEHGRDQKGRDAELDRVQRNQDGSNRPIQHDEADRKPDRREVVFTNALDARVERHESWNSADRRRRDRVDQEEERDHEQRLAQNRIDERADLQRDVNDEIQPER